MSPNIGFVSELMAFEERELGLGGLKGGMGGRKSEGAKAEKAAPNGYGGAEGGEGGGEWGGGHQPDYATAASSSNRRPLAHTRESLPPAFVHSTSFPSSSSNSSTLSALHSDYELVASPGPSSAFPMQTEESAHGGQLQEVEVKDSEGRYRHARRAPVDERTLQPMRRVSKAGLESTAYV